MLVEERAAGLPSAMLWVLFVLIVVLCPQSCLGISAEQLSPRNTVGLVRGLGAMTDGEQLADGAVTTLVIL